MKDGGIELRRHVLLIAVLLCVITQGLVCASVLEAPKLQSGHHVYIIPEGYSPEYVGQSGVKKIESELGKLHYPVNVVFVKDLPGADSKNMSAVIDTAISDLTKDWQAAGADMSKSSTVLIAFHPRSRMMMVAGSDWKSKYQVLKTKDYDGTKDYVDIFASHAKGSPKDVTGGVIAMAQQLDADMYSNETAGARHAATAKWIFIILLAVVIIAVAVKRRSIQAEREEQFEESKSEFEKTIGQIESGLTNAQGTMVDLQSDKDQIVGLSGVTGKTKEMYDSVSQDYDDIIIKLSAIGQRIDECKRLAATATVSNLEPLNKASDMIYDDFEFQTGKVNNEELFRPHDETITADLDSLMSELKSTYRSYNSKMESLRAASEVRNQSTAEQDLPLEKFNHLAESLAKAGLTKEWLGSHPLFKEEDRAKLYADLNALRASDPVGYLEQIEALLGDEAESEEKVNTILGAISAIAAVRLNEPPIIPQTILRAEDDPIRMFNDAKAADARFAGILAVPCEIAQINEVSKQVIDLYSECKRKQVEISAAVSDAQKSIDEATSRMSQTEELASRAQSRLQEAESVHRNTGDARSALDLGKQSQIAGQQRIDKAGELLGQSRHLEVRQAAIQAIDKLEEANDHYRRCISVCDELDRQKVEYENRLADLEENREQLQRRLHGYRSDITLDSYQPTIVDNGSPVDYALGLITLQTLQDGWERQVEEAHDEYRESESYHHSYESPHHDSDFGGFSPSSDDDNRSSGFSGGGFSDSSDSDSSFGGGSDFSSDSGGGSCDFGGGDSGGGGTDF